MSVVPGFLKAQLFETIPVPTSDCSGKTILVTGANTGLGLDCAKHLARLHVSRLIITCRTSIKGEAAKKDILSSIPASEGRKPQIDIWELEMTSYTSVLALGDHLDSLERLDGAILNAGVRMKEFTRAEDNETTITVNVISTALLALLLLPRLRQSALQFGVVPHLTLVGSILYHFVKLNDLHNQTKEAFLQALGKEGHYTGGTDRYNLSKLLTMFFVRELADRISTSEGEDKAFVVVNYVAPGWCKTDLLRFDDGGAGGRLALKILGRECEEGSRTLVHAITAGKKTHGKYLSENKVKPVSSFVKSKEGANLQKQFWGELMSEMEKINPGILDKVQIS